MDPRKISVKLRRDPRETAERHSQANPLTLECTLASGEAVTEAMDLRAELHAAQTPATTPLATTATVVMTSGSTGPWELEFSGAQMNQTVLPDSAEDFWLVIYATNAADDLFTLGKIALTLTFDNVSQSTPPPPEPPLYATYAFRTIAVAGQSSVVAETTADTLTLVAGSNITLTTNAATDTITIAASGGGGGGGGDVTGPASSTDNAITRFDGTTGKLIQNSSATLSDVGGIAADTLAISTTPTGAGGTGIFRYDTGEKVTEVGIDGITLKIGVQEYVRVYNDTASTMAKGAVVYISGAQGNRVAVRLADASSESTSAGTLGIVSQSITAGAEGFVQVSGPMYNLNTIGLTAGALLFLSETAGEWTQTDPPPPAHGVRLAYVERVHASVGSVYIKVDNGYELGELHNVSDGITGATAFLVKNASTNVWESKNASDSRTALGLGTLATQSGTFSGTSSGTNTGNVTLAASVSSVLTLSGQQLQAVTDPASDQILFYDQSASAWRYASIGDSLVMTGTTLSVSLGTPGPIGGTTPGEGTFNQLNVRTELDIQSTSGTAGPIYSWNTPTTEASNWERARLAWSSNIFTLSTQQNGTGIAREIDIAPGGVTAVRFSIDGRVRVNSSSLVSNSFMSVRSALSPGANAPTIRIERPDTSAAQVEIGATPSNNGYISVTNANGAVSLGGSSSFGGNLSAGDVASAAARLRSRGAGTTTGLTLLCENSSGTARFTIRDDGAFAFAGGTVATAETGWTTFTNLTTDRTCDANATTVEELADILGTLIVALKNKGIIAN